ncbi:MAG: SiaB family protein kinase [Leptospirales bacterium]|nr:SiaB family protein kinase [Leptospirales bacterium]
MDLAELKKIFQDLAEYNIIIAFKGAISQSILVELGEVVKTKTSFSNKMRDVFAIFIEMSQNVLRYSSEREQSAETPVGNGMIFVTDHGSHYQVSSGNLIANSEIAPTTELLKLINSKSRDELKTMYNEKRKSEPPPGKKGPGLGLIDIARRSDKALNFDFTPIDRGALFILSASINKE